MKREGEGMGVKRMQMNYKRAGTGGERGGGGDRGWGGGDVCEGRLAMKTPKQCTGTATLLGRMCW